MKTLEEFLIVYPPEMFEPLLLSGLLLLFVIFGWLPLQPAVDFLVPIKDYLPFFKPLASLSIIESLDKAG